MKHALKMGLRRWYARVLWRTGLHRLVNRLMPPRLTILAGHCVEDPESNGHLPPDMIVGRDWLRSLLARLGRDYEWVTVAEGLRRLEAGTARGGMVALSMDDGYRDNRHQLLPILEEAGVPASVYLETRVLDQRRLNWSHKYFWLVAREPVEAVARRYVQESEDAAAREALEAALSRGERVPYHVKRALKYDADPADRERVLARLFEEAAGDEAELCERVFMTWDDARALRDAGVELGSHTVTHPVLARLSAAEQEREIAGARETLERELGVPPETFAYPFGRRWDFDDASAEAVRRAGYRAALTSHAGTNGSGTDRMRLFRVSIDGSSDHGLLVAEVCGGFALARRLGVELAE